MPAGVPTEVVNQPSRWPPALGPQGASRAVEAGRAPVARDPPTVLTQVVVAHPRAVVVVAVRRLIELGRVLDLLLGLIDVDDFIVVIDPVDHAGRQQNLLAEDPRPRIDNDVAVADLVGRLIDLSDRSIDRLDTEAVEIATIIAPSVVSPYPDRRPIHRAHAAPPLREPSSYPPQRSQNADVNRTERPPGLVARPEWVSLVHAVDDEACGGKHGSSASDRDARPALDLDSGAHLRRYRGGRATAQSGPGRAGAPRHPVRGTGLRVGCARGGGAGRGAPRSDRGLADRGGACGFGVRPDRPRAGARGRV